MSSTFNPSRRRFLAQTSLATLALASVPSWLQAMEGMNKLPPNKASASFHPDVEIDLTCQPSTATILPGQATRVLRYSAKLIKGPANSVSEIPSSYLGPILRFETGQKIRINLLNLLDEPSITHWHGLHVPAEMDGSPMYAIDKGQRFVYEFEMRNRASMNIYHPHPHGITGRQVYQGLAGAIIVNDDEERHLQLPSGEYEIPLVIQDRQFDDQNQLQYAGHMHDRMMGFYGDQILVNGKPNATFNLASRAYRLRILNGSTARIYKLAWDDNSPITVIGTDGGLLEAPLNKAYVMLAPGERIDVWADFSGRKVGSQLVMRSLAFSGALPMMGMMGMGGRRGGHGMGMGMHGGMHNRVQQDDTQMGSDYPILTININRQVSDSPSLPKQLSTIKHFSLADVSNPKQPLPIAISEAPMAMLLNGRAYAENDLQAFERVPLNSIQLIEIFHSNSSHGMGGMGGGMMAMAHPIHLHGQYFQIFSRQQTKPSDAYNSVKDGFIEGGWKDTVLVMPGEEVRIIKPFQDFKGLFMYHCHNLEHEDMGMMREFSVE
ncbi:MAG: multicopper oxidase family protein [Methylomonas sp.]